GVYTRYPFQGALYGLPPAVIKECIVGVIEARFGPLKPPRDAAGPDGAGANDRNGNGHAAAERDGRAGLSGNGHAQADPHHNGRNGKAQAAQCAAGAAGDVKDCCGDGVMESTARLAPPSSSRPGSDTVSAEPKNFEEFIYQVWGAGIAKHFAIPYNRKIWAVPLDQMETS